MKIKGLFLHFSVLLFVVIFPPVFYDFVRQQSDPRLNPFLLLGGLTYFPYAAYWIHKIKSIYVRLILWFIVVQALLLFLIINLLSRPAVEVVAIPMLVVALYFSLKIHSTQTSAVLRFGAILMFAASSAGLIFLYLLDSAGVPVSI